MQQGKPSRAVVPASASQPPSSAVVPAEKPAPVPKTIPQKVVAYVKENPGKVAAAALVVGVFAGAAGQSVVDRRGAAATAAKQSDAQEKYAPKPPSR